MIKNRIIHRIKESILLNDDSLKEKSLFNEQNLLVKRAAIEKDILKPVDIMELAQLCANYKSKIEKMPFSKLYIIRTNWQSLLKDEENIIYQYMKENIDDKNITQFIKKISEHIYHQYIEKLAKQILNKYKELSIDISNINFNVIEPKIFSICFNEIKELILRNKDLTSYFMNCEQTFETEEAKNTLNKEAVYMIQDMFSDTDDLSNMSFLKSLIDDNNINSVSELYNFIHKNIDNLLNKHSHQLINLSYLPRSITPLTQNLNIDHAFICEDTIIQNIIKYIDKPVFAEAWIHQLSKLSIQKLFDGFFGSPWEFINFKDDVQKKNIVYSSISPYDFSSDRSGPLIIINNEVLCGNNSNLPHHNDLVTKYRNEHGISDSDEAAYEQGYDQFASVGVGSFFNKIALLEFISEDHLNDIDIKEGETSNNNGNINIVKNALINKGFKKVYINNNSAWTSNEYKRIAKKIN